MGKDLFLSYSTIRRIETGEYLPEREDRIRIARSFGYQTFLENEYQIEQYDQQIMNIRKSQIYRDNERLYEQISAFLNASALKSSYFFPQYLLLQFYDDVMRGGDLNRLIDSFQEIISYEKCFSSSQKAILYDLIGAAYLNHSRFSESLHWIQKAIRCNEEDFLAHLHLAMAWQYMQQSSDCLKELKICKELLFQYGSIYRMFQITQIEALVRAERGEYEWAVSALLNLQEEASRTENAYLIRNVLNNLAYVFFIADDYLNAIVYSKKAIQADPDHADSVLYLYIVYSYFKTDQIESMNEMIEQCTKEPLEKHIRFLIPGIKAWSEKKYKAAEEKFYIAYSESELRMETDWKIWILDRLIELNQITGNVDQVLNYSNQLLQLQKPIGRLCDSR